MHANVHVQNIEDPDDDGTPLTLNKTHPTADVDEFFVPVLMTGWLCNWL